MSSAPKAMRRGEVSTGRPNEPTSLAEAAAIQPGVDALPTARLASVHAGDIKAQMPELSAAIFAGLTAKATSPFLDRYRAFGTQVQALQDGGELPNGVLGPALTAAYAEAKTKADAIITWHVIQACFVLLGDEGLSATNAQEARASHSWSASPETTLAFV